MKNIIRKIIREDEWDWAREIKEPTVYVGMQVVVDDCIPTSVGEDFDYSDAFGTVEHIFLGRDGEKMVSMGWDDGSVSDYSYSSVERFISKGNIWKKLEESVIKEEIDKDWDWMDDISNPYEGVRTGSDYMGVWDELAYEFQESCVPLTKGYVISDDYDGQIDIEIYTPESESQPRGGRIKIFMDVISISDEMEWNMEWSFDMFSNTSYESEESVRSEQGQFYSGGMKTILQPIRDEIKKLKPYFCEESN